MKYVVLAADSEPTYAVWLPVAVRLWAKLGYKALVFVDVAPDAWHAPLGQVILDETWLTIGTYIGVVPQTGQLTIANTMRCARLVAAACPIVQAEDFILTADVDMMPLQRAFFERAETFVVLRAMFQVWLASRTATGEIPPDIDLAQLRPGEFRFPLCYMGATAAIWRELFPETLGVHPAVALAAVVGDEPDAVDLDERIASYRFLDSPRAHGDAEEVDSAGVWRKGELVLVDPLTLPLLSEYANMPRGMLRLNDFWTPGQGTPPPPEAIDYIPFRFNRGVKPFGCFDVVAAYWPEERDWLAKYRAMIDPLLPDTDTP